MAIKGITAPEGAFQHHLKIRWEERSPLETVPFDKAMREIFPEIIREGQCLDCENFPEAVIYCGEIAGEPCGLVVEDKTVQTFLGPQIMREKVL